MSLVAGWFPAVVVLAAVLGVVALVPWGRRGWWRVVALAVVVTAGLTAAVAVAVRASGALPWALPWSCEAVAGLVLLGPVLTVLGWRALRWRRLLAPLVVGVCVLAAATVVNQAYDYVPTSQALLDPPPDTTSLPVVEAARHHHSLVHHGMVVELTIPGPVSHFDARDAYIWLPPAYSEEPGVHLPVVELLEGSPSDPVDWIRGGDAAAAADAFARTHAGLAPLVVMPDENGSLTADTECVGASATYLSVDVPAFVRRTFGAATGAGSLAVAGLSEGGTCALDLALTHPGEYSAFGDYSGLTAPTVGQVVEPGPTTRALFGGSTAAYLARDPLHLLRTHHYRGLAGWFESGTADPVCARAQTTLVPLARAAGMTTTSVLVPGAGHSFTLWAQAFASSLPFLAAHLSDAPAVPGRGTTAA